MTESSTFFEQIKNCVGLDVRDARGKKHCLALVLTGIKIALLRDRDGCLSSIHRSMKNKQKELCMALGIDFKPVISRAQLPLILKNVDGEIFSKLHFSFFNTPLEDNISKWFAFDGKELRGSILRGDKRGLAAVQAVCHEDRQTYAETFYNGKKESEIPCVRTLLDTGLSGQKATMDALHLNPETTRLIEKKGGIYLIGIKENQQELLEEMLTVSKIAKPTKVFIAPAEKGHGRIDQRSYKSFDLGLAYFDKRWDFSNFQTLVQVDREIYECATKKESKETSYYISNFKTTDQKDHELFDAVRNHWKVETNNYVRDVILREDKLRTRKTHVSKIIASCRTLVVNVLGRDNLENMKAQLELFSDDFDVLIKWLKKIKFL